MRGSTYVPVHTTRTDRQTDRQLANARHGARTVVHHPPRRPAPPLRRLPDLGARRKSQPSTPDLDAHLPLLLLRLILLHPHSHHL